MESSEDGEGPYFEKRLFLRYSLTAVYITTYESHFQTHDTSHLDIS